MLQPPVYKGLIIWTHICRGLLSIGYEIAVNYLFKINRFTIWVHLLVSGVSIGCIYLYGINKLIIWMHLLVEKQLVNHLEVFTCWCIIWMHLVVKKQLVNYLGVFSCMELKRCIICVHLVVWNQ